MTRILTFAVGVVAGVIGLLVVQMPREAAEKLRAVVAAARNRLKKARRRVKDRRKVRRPEFRTLQLLGTKIR
jgi:hypothetical protein